MPVKSQRLSTGSTCNSFCEKHRRGVLVLFSLIFIALQKRIGFLIEEKRGCAETAAAPFMRIVVFNRLSHTHCGYFAIGFHHIEAGLDSDYRVVMPDSVNLAVYAIHCHVACAIDYDHTLVGSN